MSDEQSTSDPIKMQLQGRRRWLRVVLALAVVVVMLFAAALVNHNYRISGQTRSAFEKSLDQSLKSAIEYLDSQRLELIQYNPNCALIFMIHDMADLTGDGRLTALVEGYVNRFPDYYWLRMVYSEPNSQDNNQTADLPRGELDNLTDDQRWFYYVLGGTGIELEDGELALLMSPTECTARRLTHQLFALNLLQHRNPGDDELKQLRTVLCERIASEATGDARIGDMLYQRISFLLMSGRDDLIKPRWVEQLIAFQQTNGNWGYRYRPLVVTAVIGEQPASGHASVQAAWVLCQLKYRYPEWIARHYSD
jgi:hypothetical protein